MTGAGVSAESGIPTFRDAQTGLWSKFRAEDLATPEAFQRDPETVWTWYRHRAEQAATVEPNPGHFALAQLEQRVEHFTLITQNVDGLHRRAGSQRVLELHGDISRAICHITRRPVTEKYLVETAGSPPPSPHHPAGLCRPDVVWFGEMLPDGVLDQAFEASQQCDVFLSIGTSSVVEPAASLAVAAHRAGAFLIEINPGETPLSSLADAVLAGPSGTVLPRLLQAMDD